MNKVKAFLTAITSAFLLIITSFGSGRICGREKAQAEFDKKRTEENAAARITAAERKEEATREASDVQQTVSHMSIDDVDRELREKFTRKT